MLAPHPLSPSCPNCSSSPPDLPPHPPPGPATTTPSLVHAELADVGGKREAMLTVTIPERPGTFIDFMEAAVDGTDIQVTEFKYR
jgi:hypothetical protein